MAEFNEEITRLFFEKLGFFVRTNIKYQKDGKGTPSDIDLLIYNSNNVNELDSPARGLPSLEELSKIKYGMIEVKGWHTQTFTLGVLNKNKKRLKITQDAIKEASDVFKLYGETNIKIKKIIILSKLSKKEPQRQDSIDKLIEYGYDYIIEFQTIVGCLVDKIKDKDYSWLDIEQTIRVINIYT